MSANVDCIALISGHRNNVIHARERFLKGKYNDFF